MHDWKERHGVVHFTKDEPVVGDAAWEQCCQAKLAEIITVVESDESRRFAGEITTLHDHLKPTTSDFASDSRIRKLIDTELVGRKWIFEAVEKWRNAADRASRPSPFTQPCVRYLRLFTTAFTV
ncbi:MAG: hypothetical protein AB2L14_04830 [Candidatus Xenobiia bacterium LiM19]